MHKGQNYKKGKKNPLRSTNLIYKNKILINETHHKNLPSFKSHEFPRLLIF
uniref:RAB6A-GEF complex partner protein 1-like isoform X1 n=1 Tax=Rhizophora mucronata TaxID=61149 RepID=A0A2P2QH68_RHIMU